MKNWLKSGSPWVWLNGSAVAVCLILVIALLGLIASHGFGYFWPHRIMVSEYAPPHTKPIAIAGELVDMEEVQKEQLESAGFPVTKLPINVKRALLKTGNAEVNSSDFTWVVWHWLKNSHYPKSIIALERKGLSHFYGYLNTVKENGQVIASGAAAWPVLEQKINDIKKLSASIESVEKNKSSSLYKPLEQSKQHEENDSAGIKALFTAEKKNAQYRIYQT